MPTIIYQVFVDRFAAGRPIPPVPERAADEGLVRRAWHLPPEKPARGRDLYGGDLDGLAARLDHVAALGADTLYLTPIFLAPSNHKYDTADFDIVDPHFGGDAAFERLVAAARARGLGVVLDGVFNHVGARHRWARERRGLRGSAWRGYDHLPELDLDDAGIREALFGDDGVVARWTRRGATGWRLDCANDLGPRACRLAAEAARRAGATDGVVGELMTYPVGWAEAGGLDGVMNYWLRAAALGLAQGIAPAAQVQQALDRLAQEMDPVTLRASWNVLSSHDTPRLETELDGDARRVRQALVLAFAYPGIPLIYYGEEIGLAGGPDPQNRGGMVWDQRAWNHERLALVKTLCALRRREPALRDGRYVPLPQPGTDVVAFARVTDRPEDAVLFVANGAAEPRRVRVFVALPPMFDALPLHDLLDEDAPPVPMAQGCLDLALLPHAARLLKPVDAHPSGYRFFKQFDRFARE